MQNCHKITLFKPEAFLDWFPVRPLKKYIKNK